LPPIWAIGACHSTHAAGPARCCGPTHHLNSECHPFHPWCFTWWDLSRLSHLSAPQGELLAQLFSAAGLLIALMSLNRLNLLQHRFPRLAERIQAHSAQTALAFFCLCRGSFLAGAGGGHHAHPQKKLSDETGGIPRAQDASFFGPPCPSFLGGALPQRACVSALLSDATSIFFLTAADNSEPCAGFSCSNAFTTTTPSRDGGKRQVSLEESERAYRSLFRKCRRFPIVHHWRGLRHPRDELVAALCLGIAPAAIRGRLMTGDRHSWRQRHGAQAAGRVQRRSGVLRILRARRGRS